MVVFLSSFLAETFILAPKVVNLSYKSSNTFLGKSSQIKDGMTFDFMSNDLSTD